MRDNAIDDSDRRNMSDFSGTAVDRWYVDQASHLARPVPSLDVLGLNGFRGPVQFEPEHESS
jgi:hypothetical protein